MLPKPWDWETGHKARLTLSRLCALCYPSCHPLPHHGDWLHTTGTSLFHCCDLFSPHHFMLSSLICSTIPGTTQQIPPVPARVPLAKGHSYPSDLVFSPWKCVACLLCRHPSRLSDRKTLSFRAISLKVKVVCVPASSFSNRTLASSTLVQSAAA